ncbi:hypothetical protein [Paenarthrobacter sp. PH39-S1]|uniref:hypothetical protein n=1 Tax=Paenarthrobacter sp. PH39-S1 TaxID=3046204 RepID=UPI0024BB9D67|nr:hypothetical protein [Paenarthrobacter sp. PH39-S1]MDJ0355976.1 hypothetical protein [Paenarthrobacter sp. PH39-S1]
MAKAPGTGQSTERSTGQGIEQGFHEGIEQGIVEGIEQGFDEGIEQGFDEGIEQGIDEGIEQGFHEGIEQGFDEGIEQGLQWLGILEQLEAGVNAPGPGESLYGVRRQDASADATVAAERESAVQTANNATPWLPLADPGPIPAGLIGRAHRLLAAQHDAVERLEAQLHETARHLAAVQSVPETIPTGRPVFLDVTG